MKLKVLHAIIKLIKIIKGGYDMIGAVITLFSIVVLVISLVLFIRNCTHDLLGEMELDLIYAEERLLITQISDSSKPELIELRDMTQKEVDDLRNKIKAFKKRWRWFLKMKTVSCFDSAIIEAKMEIESRKVKSQNK